MKGFCNYLMALLVLMTAISCEGRLSQDVTGSQSNGSSIKVNVPETNAYIMTKAGDSSAVPARVFGSEDDDFTITEYVYSIDEAMAQPATKGTVVNAVTSSFTVDGWGKVAPSLGTTPVMTNYLPKLTANLSSSVTWEWADGADPKWVNESNLHIWSYYPVGKISPNITVDDADPYTGNTASFTYTTDEDTDLLLAYNREIRKFEDDGNGNHTYDAAGNITDDIIGNDYFEVNFFHSLAAVEFELDPASKTGIEVHSITVCNISGGNISKTTGIAMTGDCVAKIDGTPAEGINNLKFEWDNLSNRKPLHYEIGSQSIRADGTSINDDRVHFMIPQTVENMSIIVEFSNGGSTYYAKVAEFEDIEWKAGYYYTYRLKPAFHIPGEILLTTQQIQKSKFKNKDEVTGLYAQKFLASDLDVKGVSKLGIACSSASMSVNNDGAVVLAPDLAPSGNGIADYTETGNYQNPITDPNPISFNFLPYSDAIPTNVVNFNTVYPFGTDDTLESYKSFYHFKYGDTVATNYVFNVSGDKFNMVLYYASGNNGNTFTLNIRFIMVLEIAPDPNLPSNFPLTTWP